MASALVLPVIRHGEARYPAKYDAEPPWPLRDLVFVGDYTEWRHRVWRGVLAHAPFHDYIDAYRLVEMHFARDDRYASVRELIDLPLLAIVIGLAELPNRFLGPLICQALTLRQHAGLPTWVYAPKPLTQLAHVYGTDVVDLLKGAIHLGAAPALSPVATTTTNISRV